MFFTSLCFRYRFVYCSGGIRLWRSVCNMGLSQMSRAPTQAELDMIFFGLVVARLHTKATTNILDVSNVPEMVTTSNHLKAQEMEFARIAAAIKANEIVGAEHLAQATADEMQDVVLDQLSAAMSFEQARLKQPDAVCTCGHTARRHKPTDKFCLMSGCGCECFTFSGASSQ